MNDEPQVPEDYDKPESRRATGNVPPLTWIVLAVLLGAIVVGAVQHRQTRRTPGGAIPSAVEGETYMPATPPGGDAPAVPGGVVVDGR